MREEPTPPIDLTPIDPTADRERFARSMATIEARAEPLLAARRNQPVPWSIVARWSRPLLAAAAVALALAAPVLMRTPESPSTRDPLAAAVGIPSPFAAWMWEDEPPAPGDVFAALLP